jgi:hypothetical protein
MFNCREVTRLVSESLDRRLPLSERIGIRIHLFMCRLCPEAKKQMLLIREAMHLLSSESRALGVEGSLSPEARDRIKLSLKKYG